MKSMRLPAFLVLSALFATALGSVSGDAVAQPAYPSRNIQMIVPYTAGGSIDIMARSVGQRLAETWGVSVVIDNRAGASGMIGTEIATKAEPDGYMLLAHTSSYPATAAVRAKLPFDPAKAIVPVAMIAKAPMMVAINAAVPAQSVKELVALAKKNPGKIKYSSSGTGGNNHFTGALFGAAAGVELTHVPYKGIAPAVAALAAGEVELVIASAAAVSPQVKSGRIRILAVSSAEPSPLFPKLPTVIQAGVPGYSYELWWGIFAPAGMAGDRLNFINAAINKILANPDMKKFLDNEGAVPWVQTPEQLANLLPTEIARYKKAAEVAGISPQ